MADHQPPFREVRFAPRSVAVRALPGGGMIIENPTPLGDIEPHIAVYWRRAAARFPDRVAFAERPPDGRPLDGPWRELTYGKAAAMVDAIAQSFIDRGLGQDRPVMILSGNSIDHALVTLAALQAGAPVAPVSVAYSLLSGDLAKLRHVYDLVEPALVFVQNGKAFERALRSLPLDGVEVVVSGAAPEGVAAEGMVPEGMAVTPLADLLATTPTPAVEERMATLGPDSIAKYLFTSGSTGAPKGVINTHRMLCANQRMATLIDPGRADEDYVVLEWLPWSHTFGGNYNFFACIRCAGTMYLDSGKPAPGMFEPTLANLREISTTRYSNVPAGYAMLVEHLERDPALAETFFRRLGFMSYGGANLPQDLWRRMQDVAVRTTGERIAFICGLGATETAPTITVVHWLIEGAGNIGLPLPGVRLKLVPNGAKMEMRVKGPVVMPGYLKRPDLTAEAFDEDGFYKLGDAGRLVDPERPEEGIAFDGRVAEDFKLETGTWVHTGGVRVAALAAATPLLRDAVVTGHDRPFVGLLAWPNAEACGAVCSDPAARPSAEALLRCPEVREHVVRGLRAYNAAHSGSSMRIERVMLMAAPPSIDAGEITDKGYVNQRATLDNRRDLVERLYVDVPDDDVIVIEPRVAEPRPHRPEEPSAP